MKILKPALSIIISYFLINCLFGLFRIDAAWLPRSGGATSGIYYPNHYIINTLEGFGITKADANGYLNSSCDLADKYILVFGKSHTNALEVMPSKRYVELLNQIIATDRRTHVYSIAKGGNSFSDLISGFDALIQEFPNSSTVILEIDEVASIFDNTQRAYRIYDDHSSVEYLIKNQTTLTRIKGFIKERLPLLAYLTDVKLNNLKLYDEGAFYKKTVDENITQVSDNTPNIHSVINIDTALKHIREIYDGDIIILYHPSVNIDNTGTLQIVQMEYYDSFSKLCKQNGIVFCDMSSIFQNAYSENYSVPYGFHNTSMGTGHLNNAGHQLIANTLYDSYFRK